MSVNVASEAVSMIEQQKDIGLIIANIDMAHIDSHSFLNALLHKEISLILISPAINTKEASDLLTKTACFFLKKPISENDINNMWQHVVSKKSQALEKISIAEQQEKVTDNSALNKIEAFRETIKRQETRQSSLLGKQRPFINIFTTPETYQKRKIITNDETEKKREEERKLESNIGRRCYIWTHERHLRFLAAIFILGDKKCRPKAILKIMNDPNLSHRQVSSHLQKYKSQVQRINDILPKYECRSRDKTCVYPPDYKYPFNVSDLAKNLIQSNTLWHSLRKKKSSSSSISECNATVETPKFHLGGKLDLSNHSDFCNILNKPSMKVHSVPSATSKNPSFIIPPSTNSGLRSNNPPLLSGIPSSVGASSSSFETSMNQLDLDSIHIPDSYVPQSDLFNIEDGYFLPDEMDQMDWVLPVENYSHHANNMSQMDWSPSTENHVLPETNTNQMARVSSGENPVGIVSSEASYEIIPETHTNQMDWSFSEECFRLLEDTTQVGSDNVVPFGANDDVPIDDLISFDPDVNGEYDLDAYSIPHATMEDHDQSLGVNLGSTSQQPYMMESYGYHNVEAANPREAMEGVDGFDDIDLESMVWVDEMMSNIAHDI
ncbi:unnamed protein product [Thlaspi arvense]|uniref:Response regulatory domain-containing protein n=1 Tax=Thlaspi arvense TaxID=13288 RepID=A0AAU9SEH0_THLAR|nr:unnamed protein product [Thlaspi arvense]